MARSVLSLIAGAALLAGTSAKLTQCLIANKPASSSVVKAGTPAADASINCATITAAQGSVNYVEIEFDGKMLQNMQQPVLDVLFWNAGGDYEDNAFEINGQTPALNTNGLFFVAPPSADQRTLDTNPASLATSVFPPNAQWRTGGANSGTYWSVQEGQNSPVVVSTNVQITTLCAGKYRLVVNARGWTGGQNLSQTVTAGVVWRFVDAAVPLKTRTITLGATTAVPDVWFPGSVIDAPVTIRGQNWADQRYMLKALTVFVTGDALLFTATSPANIATLTVDTATGSKFGSASASNITTSTVSPGVGMLKRDWYDGIVDYIPVGGGTPTPNPTSPVRITVSSTSSNSPILLPSGQKYDIAANGPLVDVTVGLERAVEFPSIGSATVTLKDSRADASEQRAIFMATYSDPLVYRVTAVPSSVSGRNNNTGLDTVMLEDDSLTVSAFIASVDGSQSLGTFGGTGSPVTPLFLSAYTPSTYPKGEASRANLPLPWAGTTGFIRNPKVFFRVTRSTLCGDFESVTGTVTFSTQSAKGECSSHYDCSAPNGPHPAQERARLSANGDAMRFSNCLVVAKQTGFAQSKLTTQCTECTGSSSECRGGQFCFTDEGICNSLRGGSYLCDPEAASFTGICRNKSTEVLNQRCRNVFTSPGASNPGAPGTGSTTTSPVSAGAIFKSDRALNGFAPGAGFCGEVRTYNSSNVAFESDPGASYKVDGAARTLLWSGSCIMGRCLECNPRSNPSDANDGTTCVNGFIVDTVTIDGTGRTVIFNATASAAAAAAAFLCLLLALQLCSMQNAGNRHRELFGEDNMGCMEIVFAGLFRWICCLKPRSSRAKIGPYAKMAGITSSTPLDPSSGSVVNPLEGKGAEEWGTRH